MHYKFVVLCWDKQQLQAQLSQTVPSNLHAEAYHLHSNSSYVGGPGRYPPISQNQQFQEYTTQGSFQHTQFPPMFIPSPITQDTLVIYIFGEENIYGHALIANNIALNVS